MIQCSLQQRPCISECFFFLMVFHLTTSQLVFHYFKFTSSVLSKWGCDVATKTRLVDGQWLESGPVITASGRDRVNYTYHRYLRHLVTLGRYFLIVRFMLAPVTHFGFTLGPVKYRE